MIFYGDFLLLGSSWIANWVLIAFQGNPSHKIRKPEPEGKVIRVVFTIASFYLLF